ncbi:MULTISPECIES: TauD/TfdA dioxygenase family protein [Hyphomonas]|uniref:Taurine dioxygenase n=1 Tax=Hyphomonas adhaerens TaxID=81029 RepID=A0A3B9GU96_9PROT|nr:MULTISPECIES: TauD/TfdA family dioxygenase [Hyphomonas]MBB39147.1 taurine dioxygenase [Hyphomonas sp.]HAE25584.1 taurine dioxygenase [Hyphomonas adhaerens]|tara:strand:+ start:6253 stop:7092 length:840 start_codon:yes stop_codon:yes gene_type:complete
MQIETLPGVGAEITGIDLKTLTDAEFDAIRQAYADHGVIFFRDQDLTEDDHIAFAERWAPINVNRFFAAHPDYPQIAMVAKEKEQKDNIGGGWHTDHSYEEEPAMGSILVARELPERGGDTMFASMYRAYETLDDAMKKEIEGLRAVHSAKHIFGSSGATYYNTTDAGGNRIGNAAAADVLADVTHPVVITHPLSGKKALYVNPAFTVKVAGKTDEQSQALLSRLYAHAMDKAHAYRFQWQPGSIAFWDNRSTWHWAMNDYHGHRRIMHRITLEGCALN